MQNRLIAWLRKSIFLGFLVLCIILISYILVIKKDHTPVKTIDLLACDKILEQMFNADHLKHYAGTELVEYINGGAELYFAYGFKEVYIKEYYNGSGRSITVEVYEMDRSENAYGIYSFETDGEHPDIGFESTYAYGLLKFWKDRYFVRIFSESEDKAIGNAILSCGKRIADKIPNRGKKPALLSNVPARSHNIRNLRYFHTNACLNNLYYLSDENILGLDKETEAVTYEYLVENELLRVVLIKYLTPDDAKEHYMNFVKLYFSDESVEASGLRSKAEYIGKVEGGKYTGIRLSANFLILVFEADSRESCKGVLNLQAIQL